MFLRKCNLGIRKIIMGGGNSRKCCYPYGNSFFCTLPFSSCEPEVSKNKLDVHQGHRKCRAMIGPHWMGVVMTIGVILGGTMMNLRIIKHSQPLSPFKLLALHTFIAIFCALTILLLLLTATTDPGIVLPNLDEYDTEVQVHSNLVGTSTNTRSGSKSRPGMRASQRHSLSTISNSDGEGDDIEDMSESLSDEEEDETEDGDDDWDERARGRDEEAAQLVDCPPPRQVACTPPSRASDAHHLLSPSLTAAAASPRASWDFCTACSVIQDSRRKIRHCADCGYCIEGHDHHCPWMGQCVGKKNMRWFILFNISWIIYFIEFLATAAVLKSRKV